MNMLLSIAFPSQYWRKLLQNTKPQHVTKQMRPPPTHTHTHFWWAKTRNGLAKYVFGFTKQIATWLTWKSQSCWKTGSSFSTDQMPPETSPLQNLNGPCHYIVKWSSHHCLMWYPKMHTKSFESNEVNVQMNEMKLRISHESIVQAF